MRESYGGGCTCNLIIFVTLQCVLSLTVFVRIVWLDYHFRKTSVGMTRLNDGLSEVNYRTVGCGPNDLRKMYVRSREWNVYSFDCEFSGSVDRRDQSWYWVQRIENVFRYTVVTDPRTSNCVRDYKVLKTSRSLVLRVKYYLPSPVYHWTVEPYFVSQRGIQDIFWVFRKSFPLIHRETSPPVSKRGFRTPRYD